MAKNNNGMGRRFHKRLAALLCVCLLISCAPVGAASALTGAPGRGFAFAQAGAPGQGPASVAVGVPGQGSASTGVPGQGSASKSAAVGVSSETATVDPATNQVSTSVEVITFSPLVIVSKTPDFGSTKHTIASEGYDLRAKAEGTAPYAFSWSYVAYGVHGEEVAANESFFAGESADGAISLPLNEDPYNAELVDERIYEFTVSVTDAAGDKAEETITVVTSDNYSEQTLIDSPSGVIVHGKWIWNLGFLSVSAYDKETITYSLLQQAACGKAVEGVWQLDLGRYDVSNLPLFLGSLDVSIPLGDAVPSDAGTVSVIGIDAAGAMRTYEAAVETDEHGNRFAVFATETFGGAFAVVYDSGKDVFAVEASAGAGGQITPVGTSRLPAGSDQTYFLLPDKGFAVDAVYLDGDEAGNRIELLGANFYTLSDVRADHAIRAAFKPVDAQEETVLVSAQVLNGHGRIKLNGGEASALDSAVLAVGTDATVEFAADEGYTVDAVTVNGVPVRPANSLFKLGAIAENTTVTVTYKPGMTPPVPARTIDASAGVGGTVSPEGEVRVPNGLDQTFAFAPDAGNRIKAVTVDGIDVTDRVEGSAFTFESVVRDHKLEVSFEKDEAEKHIITAACEGGGAISPCGEVQVEKGSTCTFSLAPDEGFELANLVVDGTVCYDNDTRAAANAPSVYRFDDVDDDHTIKAVFEKSEGGIVDPDDRDAHTVTVGVGAAGGGTVSPSGETTVKDGDSLLIEIVPDEGWITDFVTVDGKALQMGGSSYLLSDVRADTRVEVSFRKATEPDPTVPLVDINVRVKTNAVSGGGGTVTPDAIKGMSGLSHTFYVYPDEGYDLVRVTCEGAEIPTYPITDGSLFARTATSAGGYWFTLDNVTKDLVVEVEFRKLGEDEHTPHPVDFCEVSASTEGEGGMISPAGTTFVPLSGSVEYTVKADEGFHLSSLAVNGEDVSGSIQNTGSARSGEPVSIGTYELSNVTADAEVVATFEADGQAASCMITARVNGGNGTVSPESATVERGSGASFYFYPDAGYRVESVAVDGEQLSPAPDSYAFSNVQTDHEIEVTFGAVASPKPADPADAMAKRLATTGDGDAFSLVGLILLLAALMLAAAWRLSRKGEPDGPGDSPGGGRRGSGSGGSGPSDRRVSVGSGGRPGIGATRRTAVGRNRARKRTVRR
ncbi:InlB B-repeat-containing protein [Raoultibacter phocaeensis]|uniref:InlB B-repeat-containing protein n=1 Tax=Raoultibacter phocaeensis TaxID=2479841 RepID=UPI0015D5EA50|nr:hypothetical protein [Raoultibacter phocaeensis]